MNSAGRFGLTWGAIGAAALGLQRLAAGTPSPADEGDSQRMLGIAAVVQDSYATSNGSDNGKIALLNTGREYVVVAEKAALYDVPTGHRAPSGTETARNMKLRPAVAYLEQGSAIYGEPVGEPNLFGIPVIKVEGVTTRYSRDIRIPLYVNADVVKLAADMSNQPLPAHAPEGSQGLPAAPASSGSAAPARPAAPRVTSDNPRSNL
ncbi:MAG: hypothetical protein WDO70_07795 [Alphaproteobacteria bacterium]